MATVYEFIPATEFAPTGNSTVPALVATSPASAIPTAIGLAYDAATDEAAQVRLGAAQYGSGNVTVKVRWYADTASTGDVVWGASLHAYTPNTDSGDIEADGWATENTATDSHIGTTGQRLHDVDITVSNLDSLAALDYVVLRVRRLGTNVSDTMTGDAVLTDVLVSYSDT